MKKVTKNSNKKSKSSYITFGIILAIVILAVAIMVWPKDKNSTVEAAKCIGEHSILYVQYGCSHCKTQEDLFGEDLKYLNLVDCYYERNKCAEIMATPTWVINGKQVVGVQSIDKLKELTGC